MLVSGGKRFGPLGCFLLLCWHWCVSSSAMGGTLTGSGRAAEYAPRCLPGQQLLMCQLAQDIPLQLYPCRSNIGNSWETLQEIMKQRWGSYQPQVSKSKCSCSPLLFNKEKQPVLPVIKAVGPKVSPTTREVGY